LLQAPSNPALASQAQQAVVAKAAATSLLAMVTPDPAAQHVLDSYAAEVESKTRSVVGKAKAPLCFARVPGDDYSTLCSRTATRAHGSEIGNLVAQAFLAMSPRAELAIQNGGGVRGDVPAGDITIGSVYRLLPFANTLINLNMTAPRSARPLTRRWMPQSALPVRVVLTPMPPDCALMWIFLACPAPVSTRSRPG